MALSKTLHAAFEGFWAAYPRRPDNPKAPARLVFERRVRNEADALAIVAAAGRYAAHCASTKLDPLFIPHARTWLSQRRYEDYFEDAAASAPAPAEPTPEHPLDWLKSELTASAWLSWIAPMSVTLGDPVIITAQTKFARDHVKREWGYLIGRHYGAPVDWAVQQKDQVA